jgi:hypothetical protein
MVYFLQIKSNPDNKKLFRGSVPMNRHQRRSDKKQKFIKHNGFLASKRSFI